MEVKLLIVTAISIGFIHTLVGPDHYLPFIVMSRARGWSTRKTSVITMLCGTGHVLGSVLLGLIGIALGSALNLMEMIESVRGEIAAWLLIGFGIAYAVWGIRLGLRSIEHTHEHGHGDQEHRHRHHHLGEHAHLHGDPASLTPWALFVIFILGPCEPLIPLLMYPAARGNWWDVVIVSLAFGTVTLVTMLGMVLLGTVGLREFRWPFMRRYGHAMAGLIIALTGLSINLFGL